MAEGRHRKRDWPFAPPLAQKHRPRCCARPSPRPLPATLQRHTQKMPRLQNSQRGILGTHCCTSNVNSSPRFARDDKVRLVGILLEFLAQSLPAFEVLMIELRSLERKLCRLADEAGLEHE